MVTVSSNVHPAQSESIVPGSGTESIWIDNEAQAVGVDTAEGVSNLVNKRPTEADSTISQASTSSDNAGKSVPVSKFSCVNYVKVKIVPNFD